jgi:hypothetical protein
MSKSTTIKIGDRVYELDNCPWCEGQAALRTLPSGYWYVACTGACAQTGPKGLIPEQACANFAVSHEGDGWRWSVKDKEEPDLSGCLNYDTSGLTKAYIQDLETICTGMKGRIAEVVKERDEALAEAGRQELLGVRSQAKYDEVYRERDRAIRDNERLRGEIERFAREANYWRDRHDEAVDKVIDERESAKQDGNVE